MNDRIHQEELENQADNTIQAENEEKTDQNGSASESLEYQKVIKARIERVKKAFRPSRFFEQNNGSDTKKGK